MNKKIRFWIQILILCLGVILQFSPYTTNYGGLDQIFAPLANAFCIAEIHGSIVQTEITRDRLISIYSMFCTLYEDHDLLVEYIKLLITNRDAKKLDAVIYYEIPPFKLWYFLQPTYAGESWRYG